MKSNLNVQNLSCGYGNRILLLDFSEEITSGELISLIGENGSGKSTLLRALSGIEKPKSGKVKIDNISIHDISPKKRAKFVSSIPSRSDVVSSLDVLTAVTLGRYALTDSRFFFIKEDEKKAMECLDQLDCLHLSAKALNEISDGEYQKVMIARALAQSASFMILDEPTAFLDFKAKKSVMGVLKHLCQTNGISVLFSSHDLDLVSRYADKIWYLRDQVITIEAPSFASQLSSNT